VRTIKAFPCIICARVPSENAHIVGGGTSRKADADQIVPLCHAHHQSGNDSLHKLQPRAFETYHGVNLAMYAAETDALARRLGVA
jgi:hypothetical protein